MHTQASLPSLPAKPPVGEDVSEASRFLPGFYCDPQPETLTLPKFKDILLITIFSSTVWLEVRANTSETPQK